MQEHRVSLLSRLKAIELALNNDDEERRRFMSDPPSIFKSGNIVLSDTANERLTSFMAFIATKARIADPVTMIYD